MNIFNIIIQKVSATLTVILISLGFSSPVVSPPVIDPVVIVSTTTAPVVDPVGTSSPIDLFKPIVESTQFAETLNNQTNWRKQVHIIEFPKVASTTVATTTATTTPVVEATTSPVVVPVIPLPITNQVAPTFAPPIVIIQVQQQEVPTVASAVTPTMEQLYTIKKGEDVFLDSQTEKQVRDFAETLNNQTNWRKQVHIIEFPKLVEALLSNGYTVTEK